MRGRPERREPSVARQILVLQVLVVLVLVVGAIGLATYDARGDVRASATERAVAVATTLADSPALLAALDDPDPSVAIQPMAEQVRHDADVDFVTVMSMDEIRYSHPDPDEIGRHFIGDVGDAPQGRVFTQEYAGRLGPSMRAVVPVRDTDGTVVAMVSVGITITHIDQTLRSDLAVVGGAAAVVLVVGLLGTWLVARRLRRLTHGLGEREITRMYEYYSAVLHAVREGLLLIDDRGRVQLVNDEAVRLLDLGESPDAVVGRSVHDLGLPPGLVAAALGRTAESDDVYVAGEHLLVVSSAPARWQGKEVGAVVTLRDHTELRAVTGELDVVRGLTDSLRAQNHEAANRLHTVVSLIEMGRPDEAVDFATEELQVAQLLTDQVVGQVGDPVVAALLLGKTAEAAERGIELSVAGVLPPGAESSGRDLVTVLGNLLDNAFDAVTTAETRRVEVRLGGDEEHLEVVVGDSGPGLSPEEAAHVLERGWTTKATTDGMPGGRGVGLALVGQVARRRHGEVTIGTSPLGGAEFHVALRPERVG
ncbi:ATP-binding protein [Nocardioides mangrovi]|uniref:histidine kinase n=1 Tax=Nocardioides mangrovi TaxID=2874580 RepID=A0ABS7UIE2_9ACTN|nr:sensor histidine kinase [Nocardioides mangrovi]MBZ5740413.1 sensor histidine kinase [Nocardioides mangrovi]